MKRNKLLIIILLFLVPAVFVECGYLLFIKLTDYLSLPNLNALALSVLFIMLPLELCIIGLINKKENGSFSVVQAVKYKKPLTKKQYIIFIPLLFCFMALVFIFGKPIDQFIYQRFFSFIPQKYILHLDTTQYTKSQLLITFISSFLITGIIAPITEEIYFRGFLLPRMEWLGESAPIINAVLFACYHFWSPWQTPVRIIALIPLCYFAYKTKNIKITIITHCLLNILGDSIGILSAII